MIRVVYRPIADRVLPSFTLWIAQVQQPNMLAGYICQDETGKWSARLRNTVLEQTVRGFPRRRDAAIYLLIAGDYCQQARQEMRVAA